MPKQKWLRRFDPFYGINMAIVEAETKNLLREAENTELYSNSDVEKWLGEVHGKSRQCWDHVMTLIEHLPERERRCVRYLLYRDFYHILELYLSYLRIRHPELMTSPAPPAPERPAERYFNEWLFEPQPKGDSHAKSNVRKKA